MSDPQQQDPDNKPRKVVEIQPISLYESHKKS